MIKEISISDIENIKIGHAQDHINGTGCTVIICEKGASAGIDIRGGGPASRETELLNPIASEKNIHAIFLSGGSAFGLDATAGVMQYLEEKDIGYKTPFATIPLVCTSCIFDLLVGSPNIRPDFQMAYNACLNSEKYIVKQGNIGAGTGATVGKYQGPNYMMKSGIGIYALQIGELKVAALMVVNAIGDIYQNGKIIAGMLNKNKTAFANTNTALFADCAKPKDLFSGNTTIGTVITNAKFNRAQLTKISAMAHNGMAKAISPVHTMADGDSIYSLSVGSIDADINAIGTLAANVVEQAIINAVTNAKPAYGLKTYNDILK